MNSTPKQPGPYTTITVDQYRHLQEAIQWATALAIAVKKAPHPWPVSLEEAIANFDAALNRI